MFPPSALAEARSRALAEMLETAAIAAPVTVTDEDTGETTTTYPVTTAVTRCRVRMFTAKERALAGSEGEVIDGEVIVPVNTSVGHDYQITVSGIRDGEAWSQVFEVVGVTSPRSYAVELRVPVRAIRTGAVA